MTIFAFVGLISNLDLLRLVQLPEYNENLSFIINSFGYVTEMKKVIPEDVARIAKIFYTLTRINHPSRPELIKILI